MTKIKKLSALIASVCFASIPFGGYAADQETNSQNNESQKAVSDSQEDLSGLEIFLVTAQKRVQRAQDVPISMTIVTADELARRGVQSVQDLSQSSASLEFTNADAGVGGGAFVRGVGTSGIVSATAAASVSIVLDGVVLGSTPVSDIFDVSRVEVLKGPQGTLFGSSVSAGVINMTTRAPVIGETSGRLTTELADTALGAEYDRFAMRGTANLAINENSALRVAAFSYDDSGLSYNAAKDEDSDYSSHGIRVRYLNELSERLTLNVIGDFGAYHRDEIPTLVMRYLPPESSIAQALADCGVTVSKENVDNCTVPDQTQSGFNAGSSVQFDYLFDDFDFTSITAYRKSSSDMKTAILGLGQFGIDNEVPIITVGAGRNGATGTVGPATGQNVDRDLFTQELRVNCVFRFT